MKKKGSIISIAVVLILGLSLILGCGPKEAVPEEEKYIAYLSLSDYTGPAASMNLAGEMGTTDYFKYFNDEGGVNGVKVKFIGVDTRYEVARAISAYHMYRREPNLMVVFIPNTGAAKALSPLLEEDKRLALSPGASDFQLHPGRVFGLGPLYQDGFGAVVDFVLQDWQNQGKTGRPKLGYIHWDNSPGRESLLGGREYAELRGVELLTPQFFPMGTLKRDIYLDKVGEADYIFLGPSEPESALFIKDAHQKGLTDKTRFIAGYFGLDEAIGMKEFPGVSEGVWRVTIGALGDEARSNPLISEIWNRYRDEPITEMPALYALAMTYAMSVDAALRVALEEVSYEELDGDDMYAAYQKLTGTDAFHSVMGTCAYSPTSRRGSEYVKFYKVENNTYVVISDWWKIPLNPSVLDLHDWD